MFQALWQTMSNFGFDINTISDAFNSILGGLGGGEGLAGLFNGTFSSGSFTEMLVSLFSSIGGA